MNTEALLKLADILDRFEVAKQHLLDVPQDGRVKGFCLDAWVDVPGTRWSLKPYYATCGTTACAAGAAALHPWFTKRGFKITRAATGTYRPQFKNTIGFAACVAFFQLDEEDAYFLFDPESYAPGHRGAKSVARRLRYVASGGKGRGMFAGLKA